MWWARSTVLTLSTWTKPSRRISARSSAPLAGPEGGSISAWRSRKRRRAGSLRRSGSVMRPPLPAPGARQERQPIPVRELLQQRLVIAMRPERVDEARKACHVADVGRKGGPVEIRAEADTALAEHTDQVVHVPEHRLPPGEGRLPPVLAEED